MVRLDLTDAAAVRCLLTEVQPQTVIHTASAPPAVAQRSVQALEAVIVEGTRHLAAACADTGAHLVHLSTDVVFDGEGAPYTEDAPLGPLHAYGRAKAAAEEIVADFCPDAVLVRTSLIYGFEPLDPRTRWVVDSIRTGEPITLFVDEVRCPVWVEQLAAALLELAARREAGIWHVAGPQALSRYEFGMRLADFLGVDPAEITPGVSRQSGLLRPRDCRLDVHKALMRLQSPLWGVDETLSHLQGRL
jgi:dTDP-4-dehydrorhamnose reductase